MKGFVKRLQKPAMNKTYLDTSDGMAPYAERYGALFDETCNRWYVVGEVPSELIGLLPKEKRVAAYKAVPSCPLCGSYCEEKVRRSDGALFWGCSKYSRTGCRGAINYDDYLASLPADRSSQRAVDFLKEEEIGSPHQAEIKEQLGTHNPSGMSDELRSEIMRITALVVDQLGSAKSVSRWLATPMPSLKGKTPLQAMISVEGCLQVEKIILSLWD